VRAQRGTALAEFALAWPVLLLAVLGAVELSIWSAEAFAARSAALSGARAGAVAGGGAAVAQTVAISALRPSLAGAPLTGWCPHAQAAPPAGVWVCGSDLGAAIEVRVGGSVPALVPLVAGGAGLPLAADVAIPKVTFR
jgi:Flp pilus assembly protein TadG